MKRLGNYVFCAGFLLALAGCAGQQPNRSADLKADTVLQDDAVFKTQLSPAGKLEIVRRPPAIDFSFMKGRGKIESLPSYAANSGKQWQVDLRCCDLSGLDLAGRLADLVHADFDSRTKWPTALPKGFDPDRIMELGKNPGLGLRELHAKGITGKGIGIAIIDQALVTDHIEYADRLRMYEEIHWMATSSAQMHGPAVASIAAGKTVGVAPEADLYFIAEWHGNQNPDGTFTFNLSPMAQAIDRIVEVNAGLEKTRKIRVISISLGVNPQMGNYPMAKAAIDRAEAQGIHVVYVGSSQYMGMGRDPMADPDAFPSYGAGTFWSRQAFYNTNAIMIPMDARCTAGPTGKDEYTFYREGGMSWAVPYLAGLYALACQAVPEMTWERFWNAAVETAVTTKGADNGTGRDFGKIVNPAAMIDRLRAGE